VPIRDIQLTVSLFHPTDSYAPAAAGSPPTGDAPADPDDAEQAVGIGDGELIDLAAGILKEWLRRKGWIR
jgi:hypothetical protein